MACEAEVEMIHPDFSLRPKLGKNHYNLRKIKSGMTYHQKWRAVSFLMFSKRITKSFLLKPRFILAIQLLFFLADRQGSFIWTLNDKSTLLDYCLYRTRLLYVGLWTFYLTCPSLGTPLHPTGFFHVFIVFPMDMFFKLFQKSVLCFFHLQKKAKIANG